MTLAHVAAAGAMVRRPIALRWLALARVLLLTAGASLGVASVSGAHPAPFSYLDIRVEPSGLSGTVVLHAIDVARELGVADPRALAEPTVVAREMDGIVTLVTTRVAIEADGVPITWQIDGVQPVPGQDAIALAWHARPARAVGALGIGARLFPGEANHQTFVTVYEDGQVRWQEVLDRERYRAEYFTGSRQGRWAVLTRFVGSGIHHIAIGPDHILFIIGLLLPGGTVRRLLAIVTAFTLGHSVTLALATLSIVTPPAHVVEPLIALSIVFVGADTLFVGRRDRDVRLWVALVFGLVHGFGFASVLRDQGLPRASLGVSLFAFNLGVEIGQAAIVSVVASALAAVRRRAPRVEQALVIGGSMVVMLAGAWWFVERTWLARG